MARAACGLASDQWFVSLSRFTSAQIWAGKATRRRNAEAADLVVRPEKIRFAGDTLHLDNKLAGCVTEIVYAGDATRYRVRVADDLILTVKRQNRAGLEEYEVGDRVTIGWRAEDGSTV